MNTLPPSIHAYNSIVNYLIFDLKLDRKDLELFYLLLKAKLIPITELQEKITFDSKRKIIRYVQKSKKDLKFLGTWTNNLLKHINKLEGAGLIKRFKNGYCVCSLATRIPYTLGKNVWDDSEILTLLEKYILVDYHEPDFRVDAKDCIWK